MSDIDIIEIFLFYFSESLAISYEKIVVVKAWLGWAVSQAFFLWGLSQEMCQSVIFLGWEARHQMIIRIFVWSWDKLLRSQLQHHDEKSIVLEPK